ncbi:hypothetical protein ACHHYP_08571 [Achlya hypogyna]|uniref:G-protein coupled receptors family 3 profile domain-containing protein n=1 Tax=Achlya hypogyna TaxID=1202772 RepID=A0A1V9ZKE3_ACHHY|nr:hypothetical protein ACHHYP_08571 [Achlya hypogyna]
MSTRLSKGRRRPKAPTTSRASPQWTLGNFSRIYSADWWRDFQVTDDLVNYYSVNNFNLSQVGNAKMCRDGVMGCLNGCARTAACTEALRQNKTCMLVGHQKGQYDVGYLQASISNSNIPAYICFSGYTAMGNLVTNTMKNGGAITFYHFEPDLFHFANQGKFVRISLPRATPEMVALTNGLFGSTGFGMPSPDPVSVDFPAQALMKYYSNFLLDATALNNFVHKFQLSQLDINTLLQAYSDNIGNAAIPDVEYDVACDWVKANYKRWHLWVDRLPLCTMGTNVEYSFANCNSSLNRVVTFKWTSPDPVNSSLPYDCDGGFHELPQTFHTSRSCDWLAANTALWVLWLTSPPTCDVSFYSYTISECTASSIRNVGFFWLLPSATNPLVSAECINGISLPTNTTVACDYVPTFSGVYTGIATITVIVLIVLVIFLILVIKFREKPVIKRSQWHLLALLLIGGIIICVYVLLGGGAPTHVNCGARPFLGSLGYTLCFGSLLVKSLRVYLVFENKAMKKRVVSVWRMLHFLSAIVGLDLGIIVVWLLAEFPAPYRFTSSASEFTGSVDHIECRSSSFIFPVLSIFWKAVVTFVGLYLSFLIRHVNGDFQESIWIFSASCVVLVGSLLMMTMAYLVALPASVSYGFLSAITLFCTVVTMALMLGPKFARLNREDQSTTDGTGNTKKGSKASTGKTSVMGSSVQSVARGSSSARAHDIQGHRGWEWHHQVMASLATAVQVQPSLIEMQRGSCLDAAWVQRTATQYKLDPEARDSQHRRVNPLLQPGMKIPRFALEDDRMNRPNVFGSCMKGDEVIHGLGELEYPNGTQAYAGVVKGTVVIERNGWQSHDLAREVLTILLQEVVGYGVSKFKTAGGLRCAERMSHEGLSYCTPTHINPEVWTSGKLSTLAVYANETAPTTTGYSGMGCLYTLVDNVKEGLKGSTSTKGNFSRPYSLDFWRDYATSQEVIEYYSIAKANMSRIADPINCPDGSFGCRNGCSKSYACTLAEAQNKPCMYVVMQVESYDPGFVQAMMANNDIPAYFCFPGYDGMVEYVVDIMNKGGAVAFYNYEPDLMFYLYPNKFTKVMFPRSDPANVAAATGSYGELGYGQPTTNPLKTDYPTVPLMRYMSKVVTTDPFLNSFLTRVQIADLDMNNIFTSYVADLSNPAIVDPVFSAACTWVQSNYLTWSNWVEPLPLCTMQTSVQYSYSSCNGTSRVIAFQWNKPHPANASLPYDCEGGIVAVPPPYATSKSCAWLDANTKTWMNWLSSPPICDASFFSYMVSDCTSSSSRNVGFYWLIPGSTNSRLSNECSGGVSLPSNTTIDCDYAYSGMAAFAILVLVFLVACLLLVLVFRDKPVIKRSQWHLLVVLLLGGMCMCIYVILGGGAPSNLLCGARPVFASVGYTLAFGSLLLKSLRVYLVFHNKSFKKTVVTLARMLHFLMGFLCIDVVIIGVWYAVDFPGPTSKVEAAATFSGEVTHLTCHSSSFIFPVLCIFWKAVITFFGLYVSFLIRHDDGDFQESIWIFSASCIVLMGSLFMIPLAYLVQLPATTTYVFCSVITLLCTVVVMALMLVPKFARLNRADYKSSGTTGTTGGSTATRRTASKAPGNDNRVGSQSAIPGQSAVSMHETSSH